MDLETAQTNTTIKLPLLKQGEYDMWKLRIEQYFQVQDYALWDVIENGNSFKPTTQTTTNADGSSTILIPGPVTACNTPKIGSQRNVFLGALLHDPIVQVRRERPLTESFEKKSCKFGLQCTSSPLGHVLSKSSR
ncbi:hypothetical protein Tco_0798141 [Tanacetum coccineum]